jgi:DNA-binding LytR/AlgR family response regulator
MLALIIEDEPVAARALERLVNEFAPEFTVEAALPSVEQSLARLIRGPRPDLVFMDIQLSDGLCFELFDTMLAGVPIIFTTAYDAYALRAFEVFGIDYLLKPIKPERFAVAIEKWRHLDASGGHREVPLSSVASNYFRASETYRSRFLVQQGGSMLSIAVEDVAYFSKELVVRLVHKDGGAFTLSQTLDELEDCLNPAQFFRLNRQLLVSFGAIVRAERLFKGKLDVVLQPPLAESAVVSQERAAAFREWLDR